MDPTTVLINARSSIAAVTAQTANLLRSLTDADARIAGTDWSVREAAVHLVNFAHVNADVAAGVPSPRMSLAREAVALDNDRRIADVPETDPEKLAGLVVDAVDWFLDATAERPGSQKVIWHCGFPINLAELACIELGELVLHGYDMATAVGSPWPIDPVHARMILYGYEPCFGLVANEEQIKGLTASYGIVLRGGTCFTMRFVNGAYRLEPPESGPIDCTILAEPVAFLLMGSGRLSQWAAIALGLVNIEGPRPELALGFPDLFTYP
jgi:hypothetical protein